MWTPHPRAAQPAAAATPWPKPAARCETTHHGHQSVLAAGEEMRPPGQPVQKLPASTLAQLSPWPFEHWWQRHATAAPPGRAAACAAQASRHQALVLPAARLRWCGRMCWRGVWQWQPRRCPTPAAANSPLLAKPAAAAAGVPAAANAAAASICGDAGAPAAAKAAAASVCGDAGAPAAANDGPPTAGDAAAVPVVPGGADGKASAGCRGHVAGGGGAGGGGRGGGGGGGGGGVDVGMSSTPTSLLVVHTHGLSAARLADRHATCATRCWHPLRDTTAVPDTIARETRSAKAVWPGRPRRGGSGAGGPNTQSRSSSCGGGSASGDSGGGCPAAAAPGCCPTLRKPPAWSCLGCAPACFAAGTEPGCCSCSCSSSRPAADAAADSSTQLGKRGEAPLSSRAVSTLAAAPGAAPTAACHRAARRGCSRGHSNSTR
eukprot:359616-Chlamydomonas_euryale.AAC.4